jgi:hypothetical protein
MGASYIAVVPARIGNRLESVKITGAWLSKKGPVARICSMCVCRSR